MSVYRNNVAMSVSGTPGTGTITLGSAVTGAQSFFAAFGSGTWTVDVFITDGNAWEVARNCTYNGGNPGTLTRGTLEASSTGSVLSLTSAAVVRVAMTANTANLLEQQMDLGVVFVGNANGTSQGSLTNNGFTKIAAALDTVNSDPNGWWSVSNKRFQPTRAGQYQISCACQLTGFVSGQIYQAAIYKNGSAVRFGQTGADAGMTMAVEAVVSLNGSSDYVELYVYISNSSGVSTLGSSANRTTFGATYQGP